MGTMTITIDTGSDTFAHSRTVSGPHLQRFADAYRGILGQIDDVDMTDTEVMEAYANGIFDGTKANVKRQEQLGVSKTATDGVSDINMT